MKKEKKLKKKRNRVLDWSGKGGRPSLSGGVTEVPVEQPNQDETDLKKAKMGGRIQGMPCEKREKA